MIQHNIGTSGKKVTIWKKKIQVEKMLNFSHFLNFFIIGDFQLSPQAKKTKYDRKIGWNMCNRYLVSKSESCSLFADTSILVE